MRKISENATENIEGRVNNKKLGKNLIWENSEELMTKFLKILGERLVQETKQKYRKNSKTIHTILFVNCKIRPYFL